MQKHPSLRKRQAKPYAYGGRLCLFLLGMLAVTGCGKSDDDQPPATAAKTNEIVAPQQSKPPAEAKPNPAIDASTPAQSQTPQKDSIPSAKETKGKDTTDKPPTAIDPAARQRTAILALQNIGVTVKPYGQSIRILAGSNSLLSDDLLASIKDIEHVQLIRLQNNPQITDASLVHFAELAELENLVLSGTPITDDGLRHLAGLSSLRTLVLNTTAISDAGLEHLKGLKNLRTLFLMKTKVTDQGVMDLQVLLPQCRIKK